MTQLKAAGATADGPYRQGTEYAVRATVPRDDGTPGSRTYDGVGPTPEAAARSALDQIKTDRGK